MPASNLQRSRHIDMQFNLAFFVPPAYPGVRAFDEIALTLYHALRRLGHDVVQTVNGLSAHRINILFGGHLLGEHHLRQIPPRTIVYNMEQLGSGAAVIRPHYAGLLASHPVWDYSAANLQWLREAVPACKATLLPVGYVPELRRIGRAPIQDIDVLFYGDVNERRERILRAMLGAGIGLKHVLNCFGEERDALIARSKLVLNLHAHETRIFEVVRVSYLLANGCAVVSELDERTVIEPDLRDAIAGAPAPLLAQTVRSLLADADARAELAERGRRIFEARDAVASTRDALAATPLPTLRGA
jgi:hypothetical protein